MGLWSPIPQTETGLSLFSHWHKMIQHFVKISRNRKIGGKTRILIMRIKMYLVDIQAESFPLIGIFFESEMKFFNHFGVMF